MLTLIQSNTGQQYGLREGETYVVGRDNAQIKIPDKSVSRKHAQITVHSDNILIQDFKSSNGSYINNIKLQPHKETPANVNESIQFGTIKYKLVCTKLIVTGTGMAPSQKASFHKLMADQKITIQRQWSPEVTHIVCFKPQVTKKILCGLIKQQHIVDAVFFQKRWVHIQQSIALPEEIDSRISTFSGEDMSVTVTNWKSRADLFRNKVFIFTSEADQSTLQDVIAMGGGKVTNLDNREFTAQDFVGANQHILIISGDEPKTERLKKTLAILKQIGHRTILPIEISNAILEGDASNACNSRVQFKNLLLAGKTSNIPGTQLVSETQVKMERTEANVVVAETATMNVCSAPIHTSTQESISTSTENQDTIGDNLNGVSENQSVGSKKRSANTEDVTTNNNDSKRFKDSFDFNITSVSSNPTPVKSRFVLKKKVDNTIKQPVVSATPLAVQNINSAASRQEIPVFNCPEDKPSSKLRLKRKKPSDEEAVKPKMPQISSFDKPDAPQYHGNIDYIKENDLCTTLQSVLSMKRRKSRVSSETNNLEQTSTSENSVVTQPRRQLQALFNSSTYQTARERTDTDSTANTSRRVKSFRKQTLVHFPPSSLLAKRVVTNQDSNSMNCSK